MPCHDIVAIGGSYGSIPVITGICAGLPAGFRAAVFVVVHFGAHGNNLLAGILAARSPLRVATAVDGATVETGCVYVAPADRHLLVIDGCIRLGRGPRENMTRPAIDPLFRSLAASYGPRVVAIVVSGLLDDGAAGLVDVKRCGGLAVVQNPGEAAAPDMPFGALRTVDVDYRADASALPGLLEELAALEAPPADAVPEDIRIEVAIALGRPVDFQSMQRIATPVPLTCPSCNGVLSELAQPPLRFRCQVGHAFSADTLDAGKEDAVDEALRVALRIIGERIALLDRMTAHAERSGFATSATAYQARNIEYRRQERALQDATTALDRSRTERDDESAPAQPD